MQTTRLAIIADPHFHNLRGNYRRDRLSAAELPSGLELRPLADTVLSTRLYNESEAALRAVLDDIVARGIRLVAIVGDYSDDGQDESVKGVTALLSAYASDHGLRFFSTVGNHDVYGYTGRSLERDFLLADGGRYRVSGTREDRDARVFHNPAMCCRSYEEGLPRDLGFFRREGDLHWESPFGASDLLVHRRYEVSSPDGRHCRSFVDASYLAEPVPGLWLLSIDANVFVPRDGDAFAAPEDAFADSTDAGWNALVKHRPYLIDWVARVADRAAKGGKRLIAFSHYPAVDPFDGTFEDERRLIGNTIFVRRTPAAASTDILAATGIGIHFSGHLHIDHVALHEGSGGLVNVAVPSTAGYPGGYRLLTLTEDGAELESVRPRGAVDAAILAAYAREAERSGLDAGDLLDADSYPAFLERHLREVTRSRFLPQEWPAPLRERLAGMSVADLASEAWGPSWSARFPADAERMRELPASTLVHDLYTARHNAAYRHEMTDLAKRALYERLSAEQGFADDTAFSSTILRMFRSHFLKDDPRSIRFSKTWKPEIQGSKQEAA